MPGPRSLRKLSFTAASRSRDDAPPSPTFSDATHASAVNFGANGPEKVITRADLRNSLQSFETLLQASTTYRAALLDMSRATASFADALERCSTLQGPSYEAGTRLQAASGLHHLIGNHWHVLAQTLDQNFEKPMRQHLDSYRAVVQERSAAYEKALHDKSRLIQQTEARNLNRRGRNLQSFREALTILQQQVDDLDELKAQHYQEIADHEEEVWDFAQGKVSLVVRSTMDVFDRFTAKASDPVIEPMLQSVPDPFDSYGPPPADDQIFSILQPLSIAPMASPSSSADSLRSTPEPEPPSLSRQQSWNGIYATGNSTDWSVTPASTAPQEEHGLDPAMRLSQHERQSTDSTVKHKLSFIEEDTRSRISANGSIGSSETFRVTRQASQGANEWEHERSDEPASTARHSLHQDPPEDDLHSLSTRSRPERSASDALPS